MKKYREAGEKKRMWVIEMNSAPQLYLETYFCVDAIDAMLAKVNLNYIHWKYWHPGKKYANALATVVVLQRTIHRGPYR